MKHPVGINNTITAFIDGECHIFADTGSGGMSTTVHNTYDAYGNLASYKETATNYELDADIAYHDLPAKYIVSVPKHIAVKDKGGKVYRERSTQINGNGDITSITMHNGDKPSVYDMTYDAYGNLTSLTKPENHKGQRMRYDYTYDDVPMLETRVTDALGRHVESYTDEKGRNRETVQHASGDNITVKYDYDAIGQVTTVHHPNGKATTYEYDLLGRKLKVNHPDAGEVTCTYDAAGNLLTKLTAELKRTISADAPITYTYDYERLSEVLYPKNLFNRVTYTYGKPGEKYNRAGRLVLVEDASGGEAYYYGNQGEVVKTVRSVMVSTTDVHTYIYGATYGSWNRVRTMTYPDGEAVTYHYNAAGQIVRLSGNKQGRESVPVDRIGYDKDGHTGLYQARQPKSLVDFLKVLQKDIRLTIIYITVMNTQPLQGIQKSSSMFSKKLYTV